MNKMNKDNKYYIKLLIAVIASGMLVIGLIYYCHDNEILNESNHPITLTK